MYSAIAKFMQTVVTPDSTWSEKLIELNRTFPSAPGVSYKSSGYPENWEEFDLWR
jgi:hypothetical protein